MTEKICGATNRAGGGCKRPPGWGTDHAGRGRCKLHGGATTNHRRAAQREIAEEAVALYGLPRDIDPSQALLEEVHRTAGHVAWLGDVVARLEESKLTGGLTKTVQLPDGTRRVEQAAAVNVWVRLYQDERVHLVRVAKAAVDAGVAERQVEVAETQAQQLADVVAAILGELGIDLASPQTRAAVRAGFRVIEGGKPLIERGS